MMKGPNSMYTENCHRCTHTLHVGIAPVQLDGYYIFFFWYDTQKILMKVDI